MKKIREQAQSANAHKRYLRLYYTYTEKLDSDGTIPRLLGRGCIYTPRPWWAFVKHVCICVCFCSIRCHNDRKRTYRNSARALDVRGCTRYGVDLDGSGWVGKRSNELGKSRDVTDVVVIAAGSLYADGGGGGGGLGTHAR